MSGKSAYRELSHELVLGAIQKGIEIANKRGFQIACGVVDAAGRARGVIRQEQAGFITIEYAVGKARLATVTKTSTKQTFDRLQKERPLYGTSVAALSAKHDWFLAEGGAPVLLGKDKDKVCVAAVGVSGCFPATIDQEIADETAAWLAAQLS